MLIDLDRSSQGSADAADVCVVGAGIAGLVLATRLAKNGMRVILLEAGGLELEDRSQSLYDAEMAGDLHTGTMKGRFRVFGGSSTQWGGQLLPYTEDIFQAPPACPSPSWPIRASELEPFYPEILSIMGADDLPFTADLLSALGHAPVPFSSRVRLRFSKWAPFNRRNLATSLGRACIEHGSVTVYTHANAVTLNTDASGNRIHSLTAKNYSGATFEFAANQFIIASGTIESSRLVLASGIAREHDQPGRGFHDHLGIHAALIEGPARRQMLDRLGPFYVAGTLHTCKLEASAALRSQQHIPAVMAHVVIVEPEDSGVAAVRNVLRSLQRGDLRRSFGKDLVPMLRGIGDVARLLWYSRVLKRRAVSDRATVYLNIDTEQVPQPDNRIRLSGTTDALGQPKAIVDWRVSEDDVEAVRRYAAIMKVELESLGIAPLTWLPGVLDRSQPAPSMADTFHHMGGLLMGDDPRHSVVDTNLKVHGMDNLYVASCAVFPAGGSSNPTFTLMALALRLARQLSRPAPAEA